MPRENISTFSSENAGRGSVIKTVMLGRPQLNKSLLYTSQNWVNPNSVIAAVKSYPVFERNPVDPKCVAFVDDRNREAYIMTEGNHRLAIAIIYGGLLEVAVTDILDGKPSSGIWGFNLIIRQINALINER